MRKLAIVACELARRCAPQSIRISVKIIAVALSNMILAAHCSGIVAAHVENVAATRAQVTESDLDHLSSNPGDR